METGASVIGPIDLRRFVVITAAVERVVFQRKKGEEEWKGKWMGDLLDMWKLMELIGSYGYVELSAVELAEVDNSIRILLFIHHRSSRLLALSCTTHSLMSIRTSCIQQTAFI